MEILGQFTSTCKINLYLDIVGKDPVDGYHFIESIFYEIPWGDPTIIKKSQQDKVTFYNVDATEIPENNTVTKALALFKEKFGIDDCFDISIEKHIPLGGGLGGGSGNAGCLLRWLANYYQIDKTECIDIAQKVGSDVPFFIYGNMALVEGKGEKITPLPNVLKNMHLMIINPNIHSCTKTAFSELDKVKYIRNRSLKENIFLKNIIWDLDIVKKLVYNIFNENLLNINLELFEIESEMKKILSPDVITITGSGSSFILFFRDIKGVLLAKKIIKQQNFCSKYFIRSM